MFIIYILVWKEERGNVENVELYESFTQYKKGNVKNEGDFII